MTADPHAGHLDRQPPELGRHDRPVNAVAVLDDAAWSTPGDDGRVLVWDPAYPDSQPRELGCSVTALATGPVYLGESPGVFPHAGQGISFWAYRCPEGSDEAPQPTASS